MALMVIICPECGENAKKEIGAVNRAKRNGLAVYCSRECSGLAHRKHKTDEQKKEEKRLYDMKRRSEMRDEIKAKKRAYHLRTYDQEKARVYRKARSQQHAEYCRRPEYREWKAEYDRKYRAEKHYGEFAECFMLVMDIRDECLDRMDDHEIRKIKGTMNKKQERRRDYERTYRDELEDRPLGDA